MMMREEERNETRRVGIGPRLRVVIKERVHSGVMTRWGEGGLPGAEREVVPSGKTKNDGRTVGKLHREKWQIDDRWLDWGGGDEWRGGSKKTANVRWEWQENKYHDGWKRWWLDGLIREAAGGRRDGAKWRKIGSERDKEKGASGWKNRLRNHGEQKGRGRGRTDAGDGRRGNHNTLTAEQRRRRRMSRREMRRGIKEEDIMLWKWRNNMKQKVATEEKMSAHFEQKVQNVL